MNHTTRPPAFTDSPVKFDAITQGFGRNPAVLMVTGSGEGAFPGLSSSFYNAFKRTNRVMTGLILMVTLMSSMTLASAREPDAPRRGHISGRSVVAGVLSFAIWPGIGQAVNDNKGKKVASHAVLGLLPPYRFWSAYDAVVDRKGGYLKGKI
jgi:hypothetical protein